MKPISLRRQNCQTKILLKDYKIETKVCFAGKSTAPCCIAGGGGDEDKAVVCLAAAALQAVSSFTKRPSHTPFLSPDRFVSND
jgi:hypothetical protein